MKKLKLVVFEGPDQSGKTTLYGLFRQATRWGPLAIVRFIGSNWVYDTLYKRSQREPMMPRYERADHELARVFDVYLVYCRPSVAILKKRCFNSGHDLGDWEIEKACKLFDQYVAEATYTKKKLILDTEQAPTTCLNKILDWLKLTPEEL